jgi:hypothetical protein
MVVVLCVIVKAEFQIRQRDFAPVGQVKELGSVQS